MAGEGPGRQPDVDEEFARIVAGWSDVSPTSGSSLLPPPSAAAGAADPLDPLRDGASEATSGRDRADVHPADSQPADAHPADSQPADAHPADALTADRLDIGVAEGQSDSGRPDVDAAAEGASPTQSDDGSTEAPGPAASAEPGPAWRGYLPEEPDEHFEPPEPQLPPAHDATYWLAVLGLVGGPLLVLWAVVFSSNPDPGWSIVVGILLTVAGFGLLVLRGSGERDPGDDGSRV